MTPTPLNWQTMGPIVMFGVVQLVALVGAYYGLKADNAMLAANLSMAMLTERSDRKLEHSTLKEQVMGAISVIEASMKELANRVSTLETGQDEWTKTLRARTHDLSNQMNVLALKVDRLERPKADA